MDSTGSRACHGCPCHHAACITYPHPNPNSTQWSMLIGAGWVLAMTVFVALFFPETRGVPIERLEEVSCGVVDQRFAECWQG